MRSPLVRSAALLACLGSLAATAVAAPAQDTLVDLLPARAQAAAIVRRNGIAPLRAILGDDAEMLRELGSYLEQSFGVDLTKIDGAAIFTTDLKISSPGVALAVRIPAESGSALKLTAVGDAGGTPLYRVDKSFVCARTRYGLAIGNEPEVRLAVAASTGREPTLSPQSALGRLLAADAGDVDFVFAVTHDAFPTLPISGIDDGLVTYRHAGVFEITLHGQPAPLAQLRAAVVAGEQGALTMLATQRDQAIKTNDPWKGAAQIVTYHQAKRLIGQLEPKLEGNALRVRYAMPATSSSALTFGAVGVLVGVSLESIQKYLRKSKATEARSELATMSSLIVAWGQEKAHRPTQLRTTEFAPAAKCCGQPDDKCAVESHAFDGPTWKTLGIRIDEPSRYQYRIVVDRTHHPVQVTVEARGDLDCDGKPSSFRQIITFGAGGPLAGPVQVQDEDE